MSNKQLDLFSSCANNEEKEINELKTLTDLLLKYQHEYYVLNKPSVSDKEFDLLFDRLRFLEEKYPQYASENSPVKRVGSDLSSELPEVEHTIPVLSLDKAYSIPELLKWIEKLKKHSSASVSPVLIAEEKIDGVSIVLYYKDGILERAVTRGTGETGNDVTANVKTIGAVPLKLPEKVTVAVRGEIYLPLKMFAKINQAFDNKFANPRNLAAGTIRRIKSSEVSKIPLDIFVYEGFFEDIKISTHREVLKKLHDLGFRLNRNMMAFAESGNASLPAVDDFIKVSEMAEIASYITQEEKTKETLDYEIDGLVIKIDNIEDREKYGYTGHHPKWAIAYKFESSEVESVVNAIDIQIGRTGRATPVARIKPVEISGSVVSNVTLHNQDYINFLSLSVGDVVTVTKRGDVIPAVENVVKKGDPASPIWEMPKNCPFCEGELKPDGAHLFCTNDFCPERVKGQILFFASKDQMNIENLGYETVELLVREKIITNIFELYTKDFSVLEKYEGYAQKKIELIKKGLEKSKKKPFRTVLSSLGIPDVGPKVCQLLIEAGINSIDAIYEIAEKGDAEKLLEINGIGDKTAESFFKYFNDAAIRETIKKLSEAGLSMKNENAGSAKVSALFQGQSWCVTGSFDMFKPRTIAEEEIRKRGGDVVGQVSGKTTHLLCGQEPGSKYEKALKANIKIVTEQEFLELLKK
ncbi:MAG: NAD-dependent DNA ligase LigA [Spirochaetes bacterium]|nr:NAD-dependent DNA ligase LigA [Spirochaetota bacterium]